MFDDRGVHQNSWRCPQISENPPQVGSHSCDLDAVWPQRGFLVVIGHGHDKGIDRILLGALGHVFFVH